MTDDGVALPGSRNELSTQGVENSIQSGTIFGGVHVNQNVPTPITPRQLPLSASRFIGRAGELDKLSSMIDDSSRTVVISAINGTAGIGKTALALHWAHQVVNRFPDGQLYVNLRGFDPIEDPVDPAAVVRSFLDAFGVPTGRIPIDPMAQIGLYRSLLVERRVLILLDNARDVEQVRPLLPGSKSATVVITSRNSMTGLVIREGALSLTLDLLSVEEAGQLFVRHLGGDRVDGENQAVDDVIDACARLPLALTIAAVRMTDRPSLTFSLLAAELTEEHNRVDSFDGGDVDTNLRTVFSWSYRALSPQGARLFRFLGLHFGSDFGLGAAASLVAAPVSQTRRWISELTRDHLLSEYEPGRYRFHDLLRDYAMSLGTSIDGREEREEAQVRLIHHYMKGGRNAGVLIDPHGERVELPSAPSAVVEPEFSDYQQALIWSAAEHANLVGSVQQAARIRQDILACHMAAELCSYLDRSAHWVDWAATQTEVLACARRVNDGPIEANIQRFIGWACARLGRYGDALDHLKEALIVSARFDSPMNDARIHHAMSWAYGASGEYEQALMHAQSSFELYRDSDGRASRQALALNYVGRYHAHLGQYDEALAACVDALDRFTLLKDAYGRAVALDSLGLVHYRLGDYINAIDCYESSSSLWAELRAAHSNATSLTQLGYSQYANGRHEGASSSWEHALAIFDAAGHPDGDILRMSILELRRTEGQD